MTSALALAVPLSLVHPNAAVADVTASNDANVDAGTAEIVAPAGEIAGTGGEGGAQAVSPAVAPATSDAGTQPEGAAVSRPAAQDGTAAPGTNTGAAAAAPAPLAPHRVEELTVVGTRESRTAGSAHVLRPRDLERMDYDNPEAVVKGVPGVYTRSEDGFGLRPNIGIRGTSPDRSKKVTLMEDGILFAPAPYAAPAAYYFPIVTRMELVRVIKGPGAISFGPQTVGGAVDFVTRGIPIDESGAVDLAVGAFGYGKAHAHFGASTARSGYVIEGVHLRSSGFKQLDGGGDTGFERNEWMWKGRYKLSTDLAAQQEVGLKLGYSDEDSRETYLGLTDRDFRANPLRRYRASRLDRMQWQRTQVVATYKARLRQSFTIDAAVYRHDLARTWRKVNRLGSSSISIAQVLANPSSDSNAPLYDVLTGTADSSSSGEDTIFIGPNRRSYVSQGAQVVGAWQGTSGPLSHRVEAGARYHYDRIDRLHTEDGFLMRGGNLVSNGGPTITTADSRAWVHALALHLTDATTWGPITVTPGARMEFISTRVRDRHLGTEYAGAPQRVFIPGVGVYGAITPALGVLAGVHRGFSPAAPGLSGTVKPESSVNYEAGFRASPRRLRLEAIGFFNDYSNLTSVCTFAISCSGTIVDNQYDAGRAQIYGLELFSRADVPLSAGIALPFTAAYTFTRTKLLDYFRSGDPTLGDVEAGDELPFVPRHQAQATAGIEMPRGSLGVAATYVSAMREIAGSDPTDPRTDPSLIFDVTARAALSAAGHVYLSVRNITNEADIGARLPFGARPVAPRWVQVGTKWTF